MDCLLTLTPDVSQVAFFPCFQSQQQQEGICLHQTVSTTITLSIPSSQGRLSSFSHTDRLSLRHETHNTQKQQSTSPFFSVTRKRETVWEEVREEEKEGKLKGSEGNCFEVKGKVCLMKKQSPPSRPALPVSAGISAGVSVRLSIRLSVRVSGSSGCFILSSHVSSSFSLRREAGSLK